MSKCSVKGCLRIAEWESDDGVLLCSSHQTEGERRGFDMVGIKIELTCSKCHKTFEYSVVPFASLTSVRLGAFRYMVCPKCKQCGLFNVGKPLHEKVSQMISQKINH